jgi:hypothetical protein
MRIDRNLNALITHAIEVAEYLIVDTQIEEITPCFLCQTKQGEVFVCACEWPDRDAKYQSVQAFRARFQEEGYERYVFIGEAWKASAGSKLRPSESDSRQEVVIIIAGDVDGVLAGVTIPIERSDNNTRSLGEVGAPVDIAAQNVGTLMANMLTEPPDLSCLQPEA